MRLPKWPPSLATELHSAKILPLKASEREAPIKCLIGGPLSLYVNDRAVIVPYCNYRAIAIEQDEIMQMLARFFLR